MPKNGRLWRLRCGLFSALLVSASTALAGNITGSIANSPLQVDLAAVGTSDWAHWALNDANSFDQRADGGGQISNYAPVGGATPSRTAGTWATYSWTGGTPTQAVAVTRSGLRVFNTAKGFSFSVPADTEQRSLTVYVGVLRATGQLTATLSDGSATPYSVLAVKTNRKQSFAITIDYSADQAGETLEIEYVLQSIAGAGGWASLESAALTGGQPVNQPPALDPIADQTITEGDLLNLAVLASDADGPTPLTLSETNDLPGSPSILTDLGKWLRSD